MAGAEMLLAVAGLSKHPSSTSSASFSYSKPTVTSTLPVAPHDDEDRGRVRSPKPATSSGHALLDLLQHACSPNARFLPRRKKSPTTAHSRSSSRHRKHASFDIDRSRGTTYAPSTWSTSHLRNARKSMVDSCGTSKAFNARNQHRLLSLAVSQHFLHGKTYKIADKHHHTSELKARNSRSERENSHYLRIIALERRMHHLGKLTRIPTLGKFVLRRRADEPSKEFKGSNLRYGWTAGDDDEEEEEVQLLDVIQ
jgi:hypothetical protein